MSDFIVDKLTKSVGDKTVFRDISFIIHDLDRIGLIGVNGTGKTTLLDVLSGKSGFDGDVSPFSAIKLLIWLRRLILMKSSQCLTLFYQVIYGKCS